VDLDFLIKAAKNHLKGNQERGSDDSDSDSNEDSMDVDGTRNTIALSTAAAEETEFCVSRLMDLLPAIETLPGLYHHQKPDHASILTAREVQLARQPNLKHRAFLLTLEQRRREREKKIRRLKLKVGTFFENTDGIAAAD
jgi:hypothetical protein